MPLFNTGNANKNCLMFKVRYVIIIVATVIARYEAIYLLRRITNYLQIGKVQSNFIPQGLAGIFLLP